MLAEIDITVMVFRILYGAVPVLLAFMLQQFRASRLEQRSLLRQMQKQIDGCVKTDYCNTHHHSLKRELELQLGPVTKAVTNGLTTDVRELQRQVTVLETKFEAMDKE